MGGAIEVEDPSHHAHRHEAAEVAKGHPPVDDRRPEVDDGRARPGDSMDSEGPRRRRRMPGLSLGLQLRGQLHSEGVYHELHVVEVILGGLVAFGVTKDLDRRGEATNRTPKRCHSS
jgi:hypothetical protein